MEERLSSSRKQGSQKPSNHLLGRNHDLVAFLGKCIRRCPQSNVNYFLTHIHFNHETRLLDQYFLLKAQNLLILGSHPCLQGFKNIFI